jgi:hypothetical protein
MRRTIGLVLLGGGIMVWAVYAVVWAAGGEPEVGSFLPFHLSGVIPGSLLARWDAIRRLVGGSADQVDDEDRQGP